MGYKEASHFLRNIGLGYDIAILDRHILKNLKLFNVIDEIPSSISKKKYFEIEEKMRNFSKKIKLLIIGNGSQQYLEYLKELIVLKDIQNNVVLIFHRNLNQK